MYMLYLQVHVDQMCYLDDEFEWDVFLTKEPSGRDVSGDES